MTAEEIRQKAIVRKVRSMTNEEAIRKMQSMKMQMPQTVDLAVIALRKQVPKKPIITKFVYGAELITCGVCFRCSHITRTIDYCPHCGQKIDWTEDENGV